MPIDIKDVKAGIQAGRLFAQLKDDHIMLGDYQTGEAVQLSGVAVRPVVHAYWYGTEYDGFADGFPVYDGWACSSCGEEFYNEGEPPSCNFCPNCGARMGGDPHDERGQ